jgi:glycosyltransferase involved in cell wall biosynthesis
MSQPRISIVIPTFNRARLLRECLHYAITVPAKSEIVIVDNASTDDTSTVVDEVASRDGRIRYVRNDSNIGMVPNFNKAMSEARGDYICVVCDDDLILPGHCEKKAAILERHPEIAYVYSPWHMIDAQGQSSGTPLGSGMLTYPYLGGRDEFGDLLQNNHIMMNGALFRRSMFEELGGLDGHPDIMPSPDWEMWLRYSYGRQTAYLPEPTCCVRFHESSNTVESGTAQGAFAKARVNIWRRWLVEREPPIVLNENIWQRMRALWEQDLGFWFQHDQSRVQPYLEALELIKLENQRLHERRFAAALTAAEGPQTPGGCRCRDPKLEGREAQGLVTVPLSVKPPMRWTANFFDYSGYARLSRDAALALDAVGACLSIEPEGGSERFIQELQGDPSQLATWQRLRQGDAHDGVSVYFGVPTWWNGTDAYARQRAQRSGCSKHVGIAMFETDRLPSGWADACNGMDEVWLPSEFNRKTFAKSGVNPAKLHVIPFGIDAAAYDPGKVAPYPLGGTSGFTFLSVFQWSRRKGWDVLLDAYFQSFTQQDDVRLVIRAYPDGHAEETVKACFERFLAEREYDPSRLPAVEIIEEFVSEADMPRLYRAADCFVLPTRGEGWGIPYMEAMASGLPVIATDWSAHLDYMDRDNAYLIPIDGLAPIDPEQTARNPFYESDHFWAEPSMTETGRLMRHVFENREEARETGGRARTHILENWTMERTARWISGRAAALLETSDRGKGEQEAAIQACYSPTPRTNYAVSWSAPLFDPSGYAEEARNFLWALEDAGVPVAAQELRWSNRIAVLSARDEQRLIAMTGRNSRRGAVHVNHILPPHFSQRADACVNVGRTMFETDRLPSGWADACNRMDRIWVPSEFNRKTFEFAGVDPDILAVVPGTIDATAYDPDLPPLQIEGAKGFTFLSVFDWSLRKGWDILVRAFVAEFGQKEDVCLVIKTHSSLGYSSEQIVAQVSQYIQDDLGLDPERIPDIIFQEGDLPAQRMQHFYLAGDCFVLPTRGEGWGRPYMEAMALGLPVIGTGWSGNTAFMNADNSFLIDYEVVDVAERAWTETPTFKGHRWAEPSGAHLRRLMRQTFEDRTAARALGALARDYIHTHYSYCQVAAIIQEEIGRALDLKTLCRAA